MLGLGPQLGAIPGVRLHLHRAAQVCAAGRMAWTCSYIYITIL